MRHSECARTPAERAKKRLARFEVILARLAERANPIPTKLGIPEFDAASRNARREVQKMQNSHDDGTKGSLNRRSFLGVTGAVAVATVAGGLSTPAAAGRTTQAQVSGRRRLGFL